MLFGISLEEADKGVHAFPKGISPIVKVIVQLEFELISFGAADSHFSHYATWIHPNLFSYRNFNFIF